MRTPEAYEEAARKAAERWKTCKELQLREQIIATWRMTKEYFKAQSSLMTRQQFADIWKKVFADMPDWTFDFVTDTDDTF